MRAECVHAKVRRIPPGRRRVRRAHILGAGARKEGAGRGRVRRVRAPDRRAAQAARERPVQGRAPRGTHLAIRRRKGTDDADVANDREGGVALSTEYFMRTRRLGFRRWRDEDFELALGLWGDPKVTELIDARGTLMPAHVRERLDQEIAHEKFYRVQYWPIFTLADHSHVGC